MDFGASNNSIPYEGWISDMNNNDCFENAKLSDIMLNNGGDGSIGDLGEKNYESSNGSNVSNQNYGPSYTSIHGSISSLSSPEGNIGLSTSLSSNIMDVGKPNQINNNQSNNNESSVPINKEPMRRGYKSKKRTADDMDTILLSKDDSELTEEEIQRKKKAQNRAAQRAFRERKETQLKDLQERLAISEEEKLQLMNEVALLKQKNDTILSEFHSMNRRNSSSYMDNARDKQTQFSFPSSRNDFINGLMQDTPHQTALADTTKVYENPDKPGDTLMVIGAVWDYLQHKKHKEKLEFNIIQVMSELKGNEHCHGHGPAYPLSLVDSILRRATQRKF